MTTKQNNSNQSSNYLTRHEKQSIYCISLLIARPELWNQYSKNEVISISDLLEKENILLHAT